MPPPRPPRKSIRLMLPVWLVRAIDDEARRIGIARGTLLEFWLTEAHEASAKRGRRRHRRTP